MVATRTGCGTPFGTIESAQEFLGLLAEEIDAALDEVRRELADCTDRETGRRVEVWRLVLHTTTRLSSHVANSRRLTNDLRTLRNLLHRTGADRPSEPPQTAAERPPSGRRGPLPPAPSEAR